MKSDLLLIFQVLQENVVLSVVWFCFSVFGGSWHCEPLTAMYVKPTCVLCTKRIRGMQPITKRSCLSICLLMHFIFWSGRQIVIKLLVYTNVCRYIPYAKDISEKFRRNRKHFNVRTMFKTKRTFHGTLMKALPVRGAQQPNSVCTASNVIVADVTSAKQADL
jgi:hypothetical protein